MTVALAATPTPTQPGLPALIPTPPPTQSGFPTPVATPELMRSGRPEPEPASIVQAVINPATLYPESLDQMTMRTDFIVRASLMSATAATEAVSGEAGASTTYRPVHKLRFTAHEYLKGSGSSDILVVVRPVLQRGIYPAEAEARRQADRLLSQRNTTWDDRQALLFLIRETRDWYSSVYSLPDEAPVSSETQTVDTFVFPLMESEFRPVWAYAIDTLSRVWLPSNSAEVPADIETMQFITDGAKTPHPVISLADFRSQKEALDATLKAGEGIEGYVGCIQGKLAREQLLQVDPDWSTLTDEKRLSSGVAAGTEVFRERKGRSRYAADYHNYWLSGADMDLFRAVRIDDDSDPKNGYDHTLMTVRPMPAAIYNVHYNLQTYSSIPCNYKPDDAYVAWTVTVTAPAQTMHELFFDPVTLRQAQGERSPVGADGSNGVLKPASFTDANGASATIESLSYQPPGGSDQTGTVKLEVDPHTGLTDHVVDFIELDGSVSLSLNLAGATVDSANDTLSWSVSSQPWHDGDKLMVRIREGLPYAPAPQDLSVSLSEGSFTISWSAVTGADQYRVGYRAGGAEGEWTDLHATTGTSRTFSPEGGARRPSPLPTPPDPATEHPPGQPWRGTSSEAPTGLALLPWRCRLLTLCLTGLVPSTAPTGHAGQHEAPHV